MLALRLLGIRLALERFGSGTSPLGGLKHAPIDQVRVDSSLIERLPHDSWDTAFLGAMVAVAEALRMDVEVQGIKDSAQLAAVIEQGCRFGQGPFWAPPLEAEAAREWIRQNRHRHHGHHSDVGQRTQRPASNWRPLAPATAALGFPDSPPLSGLHGDARITAMGAPGRLGIKQRIRGAGLGLVLRSHRQIFPPAGNPPDRILVVRPDHLGDLLLSTPALRLLRTAAPHARITLLTGPWNAEAARHITSIDEIVSVDFPWFDRRQHVLPWNPYLVMRQAAAGLQSSRFDTAVILRHDFWYGAALAAAAGIPHRIGYDLPEARRFLTNSVQFPGDRHEVLQTFELIRATFTPSTGTLPGPAEFQATTEERAEAGRWLSENAAPDPIVAVHPGAGAAVKLWGAEPFGEVVRALRGRYHLTVVLTGGNAERPLVEQIASRAGGAVRILLDAPLGVLAAMLQRCAVAVGVDSGIMHLAAAVGTPTVRLFGPVSTDRFGPWGDPEQHRVVRAELPCVPCNRLDFPEPELQYHPCVRSIRVDQVLEAIASALSATTRAG